MIELTLGISPCPNDLYLFSGLLLGHLPGWRVEPSFHDVETLNNLAASEALDVVKVSYANIPRCLNKYDLLPSGSAFGSGVGPLLLVHGNTWDPEREVVVPGQFTTANVLLDYFAGRPLMKRYLPFDTLYDHLRDTPGAQGVVINEKRFTYKEDKLTLVQDLGANWETRTGMPIPLGGILARRTLDLSTQIAGAIVASLDWADTHREDALALCRRYAADQSDLAIESHIALYVNDYTRDLGPKGRMAVALLFERPHDAPSDFGNIG